MIDLTVGGRFYSGFVISILNDLCTDVILGKDFMKKHKEVKFVFDGPEPALNVCGLTATNVTPPALFDNLPPDTKPVASKSRRYTPADSKFMQQEVERLLADGIIEPSVSPWRAQVLVHSDDRHKRRMVIDYSQTINRYTELDAYPLPRIDDMVNKIASYTVYSTLDLKSAYHQIPLRNDDKPYTAFEAGGRLHQFTRMPFGVTNGVAGFQRTLDTIIESEELEGVFAYVDNVTICGNDQEEHDKNLNRFLEAASKYSMTFNDDKSAISSSSITLLGYIVEKGVIKPDPTRLRSLLELPAPGSPAEQRRSVFMFAYYSKWFKDLFAKIRPLS